MNLHLAASIDNLRGSCAREWWPQQHCKGLCSTAITLIPVYAVLAQSLLTSSLRNQMAYNDLVCTCTLYSTDPALRAPGDRRFNAFFNNKNNK